MRGKVCGSACVRNNKPFEPEFIAQDFRHQTTVTRGRYTVQPHIGPHDVASTCINRRFEGRQIDVPQIAFRQIYLVVIPSTICSAVAHKMLWSSDNATRCANVITLKPSDLSGSHSSTQIRVFARAFDHAAPARVTCNINHRSKCPMQTNRPCLICRNRLALFGQIRVPAGRNRQRHGHRRLEPVDDIVAKQDRNPQTGLFHSDVLEAVDILCLGNEQQGACAACTQFGFNLFQFLWQTGKGEILGQLPCFFFDGHFRHQRINARSNV